MKKKKIISFDYFPSFQEKDAFYEKITHEQDAPSIILTQFFLLFIFSFFLRIRYGYLQWMATGFDCRI